MLEHSEEIPNESIENSLKAALGCPVTLNISRGPLQQKIVTGDCFTQIPRPTKERVNSMDGRGLLMKPRVSQEAVPTVASNLRSTNFQNSTQMFVERIGHEVSITQSGQNPFPFDQPSHGGRADAFKDPEVDLSKRDQSFGTNSVGKAAELKLRLRSISSIPQTDASIEPYSQDLLFEEENTIRKQGERYPKLYNDFLRPKQHRHSIYYM